MLQGLNRCPWCKRIFAKARTLKVHVEQRMRTAVCANAAQLACAVLKTHARHRCPCCKWQAISLEKYEDHLQTHYQRLDCGPQEAETDPIVEDRLFDGDCEPTDEELGRWRDPREGTATAAKCWV